MLLPPFILLSLFTLPLPTSAQSPCNYAFLQNITASYISAQTSGQPSQLSSSATYTENFRPSTLASGILSQPLKIDHSRSLHDTTQCATYTEIVVTDPRHPYVIGTQIRLSTTTNGDSPVVNQIDTIVTDQGDWLFNATGTYYYASREDWFTIPVEQRDTREAIQAGGDAYLDLFNDPTVQVPWGQPCARLEGGIYTGRGLPTDSCNVGVPSGVRLVNRRYVIDETVGAVDIFLDFGGEGGLPDSHEFRLEKGKLRFVHTMTVMP
ncbi:hypothetical protein CC1G_01512 [Coprinopsis cinerea okayama7|uniref:DUF8021 domain-containing protein n=1 Tax=Coprinopsis cinerea (strain Okayama-7 / 130 / ATCC MYA-4618 / FGSC 9003) TaxID=240176 RepID=A8NHV3_COPC7|nr:hypothetical protein CC1G_01512 [Coprinopsis cinerea okayama7\|eukprot:XP_001833835.1 hypothetical protein CC1G_01512 [Coprinopsis cinerea okayama7\